MFWARGRAKKPGLLERPGFCSVQISEPPIHAEIILLTLHRFVRTCSFCRTKEARSGQPLRAFFFSTTATTVTGLELLNPQRQRGGSGSRPSLARRANVARSKHYTATSASTCLASRFRAVCSRRLIVPSGASNWSLISSNDWPST